MVGWEGGSENFVEFFANVGFHSCIKWGVEPGGLSCSFSLLVFGFICWGVFQSIAVSTLSECFLVFWDAFVEDFFIG